MDFLGVFAAKRGWGDDTDRAADYILKGCGQTVNRIGQVDDVAYAVAMLAFSRLFSTYQYASPWNWLVPFLVTIETFTTRL